MKNFKQYFESSNEKRLVIDGHLDLGNTAISILPNNMTVNGYMWLYGCNNLKSLPEALIVDSTKTSRKGFGLSVSNCGNLKYLCDGLIVRGSLNIEFCGKLKTLPKNLTVTDWIGADNSGLEWMPKDIKISDERQIIYFKNTPLYKKLLEASGGSNRNHYYIDEFLKDYPQLCK